MSADLRAAVPGQAGALLAELGDKAELHDLYDEAGASVYHAIAGSSPSKCASWSVRCARPSAPSSNWPQVRVG